jgi:hypothetical protein
VNRSGQILDAKLHRSWLDRSRVNTVARGIALYGGFGEVPNVGSRKYKKPKNFMAFEGLRHHLNVL